MAQIEPLRPFQAEDLPFFKATPKSLILYEPRLGKTVESCNIIATDDDCKIILVLCSKNALSVWWDHLHAWYKELAPGKTLDVRMVRGKGSSAAAMRKVIWSSPKTADVTVYICTYNAFLNDWKYLQGFKWFRPHVIIPDEAHTKLKDRGSKTSAVVRVLVKTAKRFHPTSGTMVGKLGPADLWNLLNMCNPQEFSSYWRFVHQYCYVSEGTFGMEITGIKDSRAWYETLFRYARVRQRAICAPQMPVVHRDLLWVDPTDKQYKQYTQLMASKITVTPSGQVIVSANSLEEYIQKRQILVCPAILDPALGVGAAMEDLVERMQEAKEEGDLYGHHIVIFTAFRKALEHWVPYLKANGFPDVELLYGGLEPEDLNSRIEAWRQSKGVLICTTKYAQAFSLTPAQNCYHIGYEHDPNDNKQAEDRLVPQEGDFRINSWYYAYTMTDDSLMAERTTIKHQYVHMTLYSGDEVDSQGTEDL